jgi:S-DNA-T family DNA segregation ATPase FtsK/SpoIIIE
LVKSNPVISDTKHIPISKSNTQKDTEPQSNTDQNIESINFDHWVLPKSDLLLDRPTTINIDPKLVASNSLEIQKTLLQFGIDVTMESATVGPTVTQYRLKPADGVRLDRIETLKKNIILNLKAKSIRIQAPIPGI